MDLNVTTDYPVGEELEVVVYGRLTARSQFQAALGGAVSGPSTTRRWRSASWPTTRAAGWT